MTTYLDKEGMDLLGDWANECREALDKIETARKAREPIGTIIKLTKEFQEIKPPSFIKLAKEFQEIKPPSN